MDRGETMSQTATEALIRLDGVTKVFYTDEVETHALSNIKPEVHMKSHLA